MTMTDEGVAPSIAGRRARFPLLKSFTKVTASVALCAGVLWIVGLERIAGEVRSISLSVLLPVLPAMSAGVLVTVRRWQVALMAQGWRVPLPLLLRLYLGGLFFNFLGFGGLGGYAYRVSMLAKHTGSGGGAAVSLLADRSVDAASLPIIAGVGLSLFWFEREAYGLAVLALGGAVACALGAYGVIRGGRYAGERWVAWAAAQRVPRALREFVAGGATLARHPDAAHRLFLLSLLFQASMILTHYVVSWSLNLRIPLLHLIAFMPLVAIVMSPAPAVLGGLGGAQVAYVYMLGLGGIEGAKALVLSLVVAGGIFVFSLLGGAVFLWDRLRSARSVAL